MAMKAPVDDRISPPGILRRAGMGVAMTELIYLVCWMGVDLGLLDAPFVRALNASQGSLVVLVEGMVLVGVFGAAGGLLTALAVHLVRVIVGRRVCRRTGQAFARSLVVRNQTR